MTNLITRNELLRKLKEKGYDVPVTTLHYYGDLGLVPRSERISRGEHESGTIGMYRPETIGRIIKIKKLQKEGKSLKEITKILEASSSEKLTSESLKIAKGKIDSYLRVLQTKLEILKQWLADKDRDNKVFNPLFELAEGFEEALQNIQRELGESVVKLDKDYDVVAERLMEALLIFKREKKQ